VKIKTWIVGIAVLALVGSPAYAESDLDELSYDLDVVPVGCDSCSGTDSCSGGGCDGSGCDGSGCGSGVSGGGLFSGVGPGVLEGFSLSRALGFSNLDVGGWTQFGYHDQQTPLSTAYNDGKSFNYVPKNLNLQQQWFYVGKVADGSDGLGFGFRADFIYGTDAQKTQAFSNPSAGIPNQGTFDASWDNGEYGWAIPQLNGEVAMGDLSVKVGHFFTIVGYETVAAPQNFFYSHALTMFNSEPFTHTGVLATYKGYENMTLYGGWTLGWDTGFDQVNSANTYIGGFSTQLLDSVTLTYISTYGNFGAISRPGNNGDYSQSVVVNVALTDRASYVFQTDYKKIDGTSDEDISINQYFFYQYSDAVSFGTRLEWWQDDGLSHNEVTSGVNVKLLDNLIIRPEARKDWVPGTGFDEDVFAFDFILTY